MKPHKISTQSDNGQNKWKKMSEWAEWVEILRGFTKFIFQTDAECFSFLSWKTIKCYS